MTTSRPRVFLGSASEDLPLVDELIEGLADVAEVTRWRGAFAPSSTTIEGLIEQARLADAALFVFGDTDWVESRDVGRAAPRDNVVYEAGLFAGEIGIDRTFMLAPDGVKLPSDLDGVTLLSYRTESAASGQAQRALATLRRTLRVLGPRDPYLGMWWQRALQLGDQLERSTLALVEIERAPDGTLSLSGVAWDDEGTRLARFDSMDCCRLTGSPGFLYHWEGDWPEVEGVPELFGAGRVEQSSHDGQLEGWFTSTERAASRRSSFMKVLYVPASASDVEIAHHGSKQERKQLIRDRLDQDILFT